MPKVGVGFIEEEWDVGKRFCDTEIWKDQWYIELKPAIKETWRYLIENCDIAGFWKVNLPLLCFSVGEQLKKELILEQLNKGKARVRELGNSYWFLVDFPRFQYNVLIKDHKLHGKVYQIIKDRLGSDLANSYITLQDKDKEKDKEIKKGMQGETNLFETFWKEYPSRNGKKNGKQPALKAFQKLKESDQPKLILAAKHYAASRVALDGFCKDAVRFITHGDWEQWLAPERVPEAKTIRNEQPTRTAQNFKPDEKECSPPPKEFLDLAAKIGNEKK